MSREGVYGAAEHCCTRTTERQGRVRLKMPTRPLRLTMAFVALLLAVSALSPIHLAASDSLPTPPIPAANIPLNPNFLFTGACYRTRTGYSCANPCVTSQMTWPVYNNDPACTQYLLSAINNARATMNEVPMVLPSNWYTLTQPEQLFVLANLERIGLGYPPYLGLNATLSAAAQAGAQAGEDPTVPSGFPIGKNDFSSDFGGAWSEGFNALVADYLWMYADGWGGSPTNTSNGTCTSATAVGCWGHREELLGSDPGYNSGVGLGCTTCEMGTGYALDNGVGEWDDLVVLPLRSPPPMTFTWASEVAYFSPGHFPPTTTTTTTTIPAPPPAPLTAFLKKLVLQPNLVSVAWSSPGMQGVREVDLWTFKGKGCNKSYLAGGPNVYYQTSTNTTSGRISSRGLNWTDRRAVYSATVRVFNASGSKLSACVSLGKS